MCNYNCKNDFVDDDSDMQIIANKFSKSDYLMYILFLELI